MKNRIFYIFCIGLLLAFNACKQSSDSMNRTPIFMVLGPDGTEESAVTIDGRAQQVKFTVFASEDWTANLDGSDAFTLSEITGGSGKVDVVLIATANETGTARSVTVRFSLSENKENYFFNISQEEQRPYLEVTPSDVVISSYGGEFTVTVSTNQSDWAYDLSGASSWINLVSKTETTAVFSVPENTSGAKRQVDMKISATNAPELFAYMGVSQDVPAAAPTADLLDIVFDGNRKASDISSMQMTVDNTRLNADVTVGYNEKYERFVAQFNNPTIARSGLDTGYWLIPYTTTSSFANKLADGFSYELLFCNYEDAENKQVKPFSSTQAGGTGVCLRAATGEINFEVHIGGSWQNLYSGVIPKKDVYYHVVAIWDKANGLAYLYVDGVLTDSKNISGNFKFMDTNVDARWFGIGADPNHLDQGEASFHGEVAIARLYDNPLSAEEVLALYNQVK